LEDHEIRSNNAFNRSEHIEISECVLLLYCAESVRDCSEKQIRATKLAEGRGRWHSPNPEENEGRS